MPVLGVKMSRAGGAARPEVADVRATRGAAEAARAGERLDGAEVQKEARGRLSPGRGLCEGLGILV